MNYKKILPQLVLILLIIFVISCDEEVSQSPVEPSAPEGFIYINSIPPGFTIFQDGRNTGRLTPDSIPFVEAGNYDITLKKKYFKDTTLASSVFRTSKDLIVYQH